MEWEWRKIRSLTYVGYSYPHKIRISKDQLRQNYWLIKLPNKTVKHCGDLESAKEYAKKKYKEN